MDGTGHIKCPLCSNSFVKAVPLREHLRRKHPIDGPKQWKQIINTVCLKCSKTFETPEELAGHRQEEHTNFKCGICQIRCTSAAALSYHRNSHSSKKRNHKCDVSEFFFFLLMIINYVTIL